MKKRKKRDKREIAFGSCKKKCMSLAYLRKEVKYKRKRPMKRLPKHFTEDKLLSWKKELKRRIEIKNEDLK